VTKPQNDSEIPAGPAPRDARKSPDSAKAPFDPSRFGAIEIPPELRAQLLTLELPRIPREQLDDTVPPTRIVTTGGAPKRTLAVWLLGRRALSLAIAAVAIVVLGLGLIWWTGR
jgi:hypothetical protein